VKVVLVATCGHHWFGMRNTHTSFDIYGKTKERHQ